MDRFRPSRVAAEKARFRAPDRIAELERRIAAAKEMLEDSIDGAPETLGHDQFVSRVIRILEGATGVFA